MLKKRLRQKQELVLRLDHMEEEIQDLKLQKQIAEKGS